MNTAKIQLSPQERDLINNTEFKLQNGYRYEEKGGMSSANNEFIRLSFKEYNKLFDLSQLDIQKTADSLFKTGYRMKTIGQLNKAIDSLKKYPDELAVRTGNDMKSYLSFLRFPDNNKKIDTAKTTAKSFDELIPDTLKSVINDLALSNVANLRNSITLNSTDLEIHTRELRFHEVEWHRKFSLSFACLVLFFIGAPLGSIIRRGGLGLPLVVALIFFMAFHLLNMFGEKFVKNEALTPFEGMWLSVAALIPIGAFLTYKATHDSQLFNKEFYYRSFKKINIYFKPLLSIFRREKSSS